MAYRPNLPTVSDQGQARRRQADRWCHTEPHHGNPGPVQLNLVRRVAKTSLVPGTVVWAHVPFEDQPSSKLRPAVIIRVVGRDVTVRPATSSASRHRYPGRHNELVDPAAAGLARATGVRRAEMILDLIDVIAVIGQLGPADHHMVLGPAENQEGELRVAA